MFYWINQIDFSIFCNLFILTRNNQHRKFLQDIPHHFFQLFSPAVCIYSLCFLVSKIKGAPPVGPRFFKKRSDHMCNLLKIYFLTRWIRICKKIGGLPLRFARKLHLKIDDSRYTEFPYEWWRIQFYRHLVVKYGRTLYIFPLNQACIFQPDGFQPRFNCLTSW